MEKENVKGFKKINSAQIVICIICFLISLSVTIQARSINTSESDVLRLKRENELRDEITQWKEVYEVANSKIAEQNKKYKAMKRLVLLLFILLSANLAYGQQHGRDGGHRATSVQRDSHGHSGGSTVRSHGSSSNGGRQHSGSVSLPFEAVLERGGEADVWLFRYSGDHDITYQELAREHHGYSQFRAFRQQQAYGCDVERSNFYEETPFRPDWLLGDLIHILHPELPGLPPLRYYKPLSTRK